MGSKGEQDLKLTAKTEGFDAAASKVDKLTASTQASQDKVKSAGKTTKEAAEAQQKLNASESDYIGILTQINPALGGLVDGLLKSGKVAGDLASKNINLASVFEKATTAIKGNAAALKLIGAGGAVVLSIFAIIKAIEKMKEDAEAAAKAIRDQTDALNELNNARADQKQSIEDISDKRRIGGLTADAARKAVRVAKTIGQRTEGLSPEAINQVVGFASDAGLSSDQLAKAAFLQQSGRLALNQNLSKEGIKRVIEGAIRRNTEAIAKFFTREKTQGQGLGVSGERAQQAGIQLNQQGGDTTDIRAIVKQFAPAGSDIDKLVTAIIGANESGVLERAGRTLLTNKDFGGVAPTDTELVIVKQVLQQIKTGANRNAAGSGGITINVDRRTIQHNGKYIGVGVAGRRKRSRQETIESG